jgi:hypothetical protein
MMTIMGTLMGASAVLAVAFEKTGAAFVLGALAYYCIARA